jgi:hypothetical protein
LNAALYPYGPDAIEPLCSFVGMRRALNAACWFALAGATSLGCGAGEHEDDWNPEAPRVVSTVPADGERGVDPELFALVARFSESMEPSEWSWVAESGHAVPEIAGVPFYVDDVTNVLPVRLQPSTTYVIWVNSPSDAEYRKFRSETGVAARAHRVRFETAASAR